MHIINLRKHYPHYIEDIFLEVSDEVYEVILLSIRQKNNYDSRMYYHRAHYSLDCDDGIENDALPYAFARGNLHAKGVNGTAGSTRL